MWYVAKIVSEIKIEGNFSSADFDEQWILLEAPSEREALRQAENRGKNAEDAFVNVEGKWVSWIFSGVEDLVELHEIKSGSVLFSSTREVRNRSKYKEMLAARLRMTEARIEKNEHTVPDVANGY